MNPTKRSAASWPLFASACLLSAAQTNSQGIPPGSGTYGISDPHILLAPYVWKCTGEGSLARAEATMPGAYLRVLCGNTANISLLLDGSANVGETKSAPPIIDCSVDGAPFKSFRMSLTGEVYAIELAQGLNPAITHRVEVVFRSAPLGGRWDTSKGHLRLAGVQLSPGGTLLQSPRRVGNAIAFGDSITEGVLAEGLGPFYVDLTLNNAGVTWVPVACSALQVEYGQLGTGGQGMVKPIEIPPLPMTWDRYDAFASRLTAGRLTPEPDYVFCLMGTNDFIVVKPGLWRLLDITDEYSKWLAAVRLACPHAAIFCITPPLGVHSSEISAAVRKREKAGDLRVFLIDTAPLRDGFLQLAQGPDPGTYTHVDGATVLAVDGVHPSVYGNAILGSFIAAKITACVRGGDTLTFPGINQEGVK